MLLLNLLTKAPRTVDASITTTGAQAKKRPTFRQILAVAGPGIIAAAAGNDAGGIATYSQAGAQYGYSLLWAMVVVTVGLVVVQEMCARMGAVTGKGLADLIRENFGVKVTLFAMLALLAANFALTVSEFAGIAAVGEMFLGPKARFIVVPISMVLVWLLVAKGSYEKAERIFVVSSLVFGIYLITGFEIGIPWGTVVQATLLPKLGAMHWDSDLILMIVTLIGTTISPYMQFFQQSAVRDKGLGIKKYALTKLDSLIGCLSSDIVAGFIIITCAGTLFAHGQHNIDTAADAAAALQPIAGKYAQLLFAFGLLNASLMAAVVVPLSTAYAVTESLGWESGIGRHVREQPLFFGTYGFLTLFGGLLVIFLPANSNLIKMILNAQVINCALLPVELILILVLVNRRRIMGTYRNTVMQNIVAWTVTIVAGSLSLYLLFHQISGMLGHG